ncbi:MAG: MMPL family transporter [Thermoleophilaceae bacterium]
MLRGEFFARAVSAVARRPVLVLAVVGLLAVGAAVFALRLEPSASTDTLVNRSSSSFKATESFKREFGDDAVVILVKGDLERTLLTSDLATLIKLEGCLSGNVPAKSTLTGNGHVLAVGLDRMPSECRQLARTKPVKVVYGPGTFTNTAAERISQGILSESQAAEQSVQRAENAARQLAKAKGYTKAQQDQLAGAAANLALNQYIQQALQLAVKYGLTTAPSIDNTDFVSQLWFDPTRGVNVPKARFAFLAPSPHAALIQVRLKPNLSNQQHRQAISLIERATKERVFQLNNGQRYVVSGVPVVADALAQSVQHAIFVLLVAVLLVMAAVLALVFKARLRMLPLALALAAAGLAFGAVALVGGKLTMASVAALPVLIGLAVDYAIQFHARFEESSRTGLPPEQAAPMAASLGGPTIATAGLATSVGFLVLLLSPVPMVRGFGGVLVLGIALAFACALTAGFAALVRFGRPREAPVDVPPVLPRVRAQLARLKLDRAWAFARRTGTAALEAAILRPRKVLAVGLALAVLGWAADTQTKVISDVRQLVPQDMPALKDVNELQQATGLSGEIDVMVRAPDLTDPSVVQWMTTYEARVLAAHGYRDGDTCLQAKNPPELCPAFSLPDLFRTSTQGITRASIQQFLTEVPTYFSQGVISPDHKVANMAFGIRLMPLDQQKKVIDDIRSKLNPPPGVTADVVGLPVLAAEANHELSSTSRRALTLLAGIVAVFLVLLAVRRRVRHALVPVLPIAFATGWSALVLFVLRIPLNPMSAALGALVIAISTEFSVLLSARYREEREVAGSAAAAIRRTYASTGAAVLASGTTAIAGFAALTASDIRMLRDFGIVTVVDLTVSLLGVMIVLPAALVWSEEHGPFRLRDLDPRGPLRGAMRRLRQGRPRLRLSWRRSRA